MPLILDASVAVKFVVEEPGSEAALALLDLEDRRLAPDWIVVEAAAALWNKVKYSQLLEIHASESLEMLPRFLDELVPSKELIGRAFELAFRLRHPVYDCLYLALAIERDGVLWTADKALVAAAARAGLGSGVSMLSW